MSLKRRLMLWLVLATLAVWVIMGLFVYQNALHEVNEVFDGHLAQSARFLMAMVKLSAERGELSQLQERLPALEPGYRPTAHAMVTEEEEDRPGFYERIIAYQVFMPGTGFILASETAPQEQLSQNTSGFAETLIDGQQWRVFNLVDPGLNLQLHAGEQYEIREELACYLAQSLIFPVFLSVPPLVLIVWFALSRGLHPLLRLVREIKRRDPQDLTPLYFSQVPLEVTPLVGALNALLQRLDKAIEGERAFTGDAAHELRTPLAGLRVQAQVALRTTDDEIRRKALDQIIAGVDQAGHLVEQLLTLSRLDVAKTLPSREPVNLYRTALSVARDLERLAQKRSVLIRVHGAKDGEVQGDPGHLGILIRNLLDNAIRYSPNGEEVSVEVVTATDGLRLIVGDHGHGIAQSQHDEVFLRFHRLADTQSKGSGLGLSIVRRIAELHGAKVRLLDRPEGGLLVEVGFPPTNPD